MFCRRLARMADKKTPYAVVEFHLKQIMEERGLSVPQVSKLTGITHSALYMMLDRLPRAVRFDTIARLCAGLDVMPADLLVIRMPPIRK